MHFKKIFKERWIDDEQRRNAVSPEEEEVIEEEIEEDEGVIEVLEEEKIVSTNKPGFLGSLLGIDQKSYIYVVNQDTVSHKNNIHDEWLKLYSIAEEENKKMLRLKDIKIGENYVLFFQNIFLRVRTLKINWKSNSIFVLELDFGKPLEVEAYQLFLTDERFYLKPFGVIQCKLFGLDDLFGLKTMSEILKHVQKYKTFLMTIINPSAKHPSIVIQLQNSKNHETLNSKFREIVEQFNPFPNKFEVNMIVGGGEIVRIGEHHLWYRYRTGVSEFLETIRPLNLPKLDPKETLAKIDAGCEDFVVFLKDKYLRVRIFQEVNAEEFYVFAVDFGLVWLVDIEELIPFEYFSLTVKKIPHQCRIFKVQGKTGMFRQTLQEQKRGFSGSSTWNKHELWVVEVLEGEPIVLPIISIKTSGPLNPKSFFIPYKYELD